MTGTQNGKPVVMVVNDNTTQCDELAGLLKNDGMDVLTFADAEAALEALGIGLQPDLIVTALYMPGIDGWRFCRLLRSPDYAYSNDVPILVVSETFSGDEPARISADLGANAFLPQPVDSPRLLKTVQALLHNEATAPKPRVLIVDDLRDIAVLLQATLQQQGYDADIVCTGEGALDLFNCGYSIAILDYHLPAMDTCLHNF